MIVFLKKKHVNQHTKCHYNIINNVAILTVNSINNIIFYQIVTLECIQTVAINT